MIKPVFDPAKRQTIKLLTGTAVVAMAPTIASASVANVNSIPQTLTETSMSAANAELAVSLLVDDEAVLHMTNNSDRLLIVRHIHPGIVHAGRQTFNINAAFARSAYAISAGSTRRVVLQPIEGYAAETEFPRARYSNQPQRIVSVTGSDAKGSLVNSTRSFYA